MYKHNFLSYLVSFSERIIDWGKLVQFGPRNYVFVPWVSSCLKMLFVSEVNHLLRDLVECLLYLLLTPYFYTYLNPNFEQFFIKYGEQATIMAGSY